MAEQKQRRRPGKGPLPGGDDDFPDPLDSEEERRRRKEIDDLVDREIERDDTEDYVRKRREKSGE
ncbi:hypothetical protein IIA95_01750 [Patescibacteria group bacterium]|nr:hypothetical protein [Patescibacteria group bacterium]